MKRGAPRVVAVLAGLLERAAERGDAAAEEGAQAAQSAFRGRAVPGIPVRRYAERIYRYAGCSPACFVAAYVYLDRLLGDQGKQDGDTREAAAGVVVDSLTVHRLLITAVMVAAKFMDDRHHNNAYFARVGGVEVSEMNALELRLLFALRFRLNVAPDTFARCCAALEAEMLLLDASPSSALPMTQGEDDDEEAVDEDEDHRHDDRDRRRRQALLLARAQDAASAQADAAGSRAVLVVVDTR